MADLYVKKFDMINPFVVASSPATQGALNVLKSAKMRPGAIVLRNYGHGSGGGSFIGPDSKAMLGGEMAIHSHAVGRQIPDSVDTLENIVRKFTKSRRRWTLTSSCGCLSAIIATSSRAVIGRKTGRIRRRSSLSRVRMPLNCISIPRALPWQRTVHLLTISCSVTPLN